MLKVVEANLSENQDILMIFMPRKGPNKRCDQENNSDDLSLSDVSEIYKNIDDF